MASHEKSEPALPIPALLVERAIALAHAETGLALVHTRIAIRAVNAVLGTTVACALTLLTLSLLVEWPVLAPRVPLVNLPFGVLASALVAGAGAAFAFAAWARVGRERRPGPAARNAVDAEPVAAQPPLVTARAREPMRAVYDTPKPARTVDLAERMSL